MRLLYVIDSLAPGGAESSLMEMAPCLIRAGVELHVLPLTDRMHLASKLQAAGATIHAPSARSGRIGNVARVVHAIRTVNPDLVHTTLYEANIAGRIGSWLTRKPTSTSLVGDTYGEHRTSGLNRCKIQAALAVDRITCTYSSRFHAVSNSIADSAVRHLHVDRRHITVIPRGRDPLRFPFQPSDVRAHVRLDLGISDHTPVVLAVGRHEPAKGLIDLIDATARLSEKLPGLVVLVAGKDGQASEQLRLRATNRQPEIRFLGHREDVPDLLAAADLLCFPSVSEGSPGTLIEAMAVGCPILATTIPANLEVLGHAPHDLAWLAPPQDPIALAEAIQSALLDSGRAKVLRSRARFEAEFQVGSVATRMTEFFEQAAQFALSKRE